MIYLNHGATFILDDLVLSQVPLEKYMVENRGKMIVNFKMLNVGYLGSNIATGLFADVKM